MMFDRSWYNRAGVERVMGCCSPQQYLEFMRETPNLERMLVNSGIHIIKFRFSVSQREQLNRYASRETDPVRRWKLSPTDLASPDKDERIVHRPDPHICALATELFETGEDSGGSFPRVC
ncbi:polyphosphate kinase 2 (PPK2 family) [Micrococcus endophyticus]|uniref:Polyphosphate kinase 2 (PPK2 family) n=1 Tax=Micrococcus endophyticus TaxID=455343 RepID=A0A7W9JHI5_9MICC|nr:polyphosphate kinase 2 (PPK2 family) [Micrococcus endophyticus]